MRVKFWGVRGSIPTPEHRNHRYGGNTTCLEVRLANGSLFVLDCGSGGRALGKSLQREFGEKPINGFFLMSHFHWDHIQGVPFFAPLYRPGNSFLFLAVNRKKKELQELIEGQMGSPHFPVDMSALGASRTFCILGAREIEIEGALIRSAPQNHPQGSVAYRIEADDGSLVFATDTEPGSPMHDRALHDLAQGADVLVYDAQYTPEQLQAEKKGWGHGSWLEGVRIAHECGVHRLILFHHDPDSDDEYVDNLVEHAREVFPNVDGAAEGLEIILPQQEAVHTYEPSIMRRERRYHVDLPVRVVWGSDGGRRGEAEGIVVNMSESAIYFLAPENVPARDTLGLEIAIPSEITGQGKIVSQVLAQPVRRHLVNRALGGKVPCVGVVARRIDNAKAAQDHEFQGATEATDA